VSAAGDVCAAALDAKIPNATNPQAAGNVRFMGALLRIRRTSGDVFTEE
jgi:hypothetical protein